MSNCRPHILRLLLITFQDVAARRREDETTPLDIISIDKNVSRLKSCLTQSGINYNQTKLALGFTLYRETDINYLQLIFNFKVKAGPEGAGWCTNGMNTKAQLDRNLIIFCLIINQQTVIFPVCEMH